MRTRPARLLAGAVACIALIGLLVVATGGHDSAAQPPHPGSSGGTSKTTSLVPPLSPSPGRTAGATVTAAGDLLIADRGNGRLLIVDRTRHVLWRFPVAGSLPKGQHFAADDAFIAPDGKTIVANDEAHEVVDRIDIATRRVVWQYGHYDQPSGKVGWLHTPDDAYPLANGDITVADIRNCRVLEVDAAKRVVRSWGHAGACSHRPPAAFDEPNGDTPLPDGGLLVTEITGSRVVRLNAAGGVVFDIHAPVSYPSDAQLDDAGNVVVVDYSSPGAILRLDPRGRVLWRYRPTSVAGRLDHPSLAVPLPDGTIALNDDFRHRVVIIDPATCRIVWQYGHTDRPSARDGYLDTPDGIDPVPAGLSLP